MTDQLPGPSKAAFHQDQYLDGKRAGDLLGIAAHTLAKLRLSGGGPAYSKLGVSVRYRVGDLLDWAQSKRVASTSEKAA